jgi:MFS family permease
MMGTFLVIPLLPYYAKALGANAFVYTCLVASFSLATLLSAPYWGRFSDRYGRRPALLIALGASAVAFVVFGFANSLWMLLLSRLVQGAGGGTVGVIQAYVADCTEPKDRAKALGWLSAATNVGITIGPALGSLAVLLGGIPLSTGAHPLMLGRSAPGVLAALICLVNMYFVWRMLGESHTPVAAGASSRRGRSWSVVAQIVQHPDAPASRLIWIYAIAIGAFYGATSILAYFLNFRFGVTTATIGYFFTYVGVISVISRAVLLGPAVDRLGEPRLSRIGTVMLVIGLVTVPLSRSIPVLALTVAIFPLGTAFMFPCVTALLSRVIPQDERGVYMGAQQTFGGVARVIFPLGAGWLYDTFVPGVPFWCGAVLVGGTLFLGLDMETYARQDGPATGPPRDAGAHDAAGRDPTARDAAALDPAVVESAEPVVGQ